MNRILTLTHSNAVGIGERKQAIKNQPARVGRVTLNFLLVMFIAALGVFYIFEVNSNATKGFEIRTLEKRVQELKDSQEKLKIKEAELKSMYNIEERTKNLNMVAPKDVSYLTLPGSVAMR
jgi:hypothetical protein